MTKGFRSIRSQRQHDVLEFPSTHPELVERDLAFNVMPGVFAGELYPPRESVGGVYLPSSGGGWESEGAAAERVRPDCVTVLQMPFGYYGNDPTKQKRCQQLRASLVPGCRVMVRPESGVRYQEAYGVKGLSFFGQTDDWREDAILVEDEGRWLPLTNWVVVKLDPVWGGDIQSAISVHDVKGIVLDSGPFSSVSPGERVVLADDQNQQSDDDIKWFTTKWGEWGEDVWLVREVDCDGKRRVVAILE